MLITKAAAKSLREITAESNASMPQDDSQAKKVMRNRPDSAIGQMLHHSASLEEVAIWIAKRTLERWIRVLKPFASGPGLAILISRIVHEDFTRTRIGSSPKGMMGHTMSETVPIIPGTDDFL